MPNQTASTEDGNSGTLMGLPAVPMVVQVAEPAWVRLAVLAAGLFVGVLAILWGAITGMDALRDDIADLRGDIADGQWMD